MMVQRVRRGTLGGGRVGGAPGMSVSYVYV
jgi:hypothetical protein